jgi:hypothetical protein
LLSVVVITAPARADVFTEPSFKWAGCGNGAITSYGVDRGDADIHLTIQPCDPSNPGHWAFITYHGYGSVSLNAYPPAPGALRAEITIRDADRALCLATNSYTRLSCLAISRDTHGKVTLTPLPVDTPWLASSTLVLTSTMDGFPYCPTCVLETN